MRTDPGVDAPPVKSPERQMPSGPEDADVARTPGRLDLKLLRLAVHGWWLGNPLVYKPGTADLGAVARELAGAGARSGTLVLDDRWRGVIGPQAAEAAHQDVVQLLLILRPALPREHVGPAVARAVAEVAQDMTGCSCALREPWQVALERGHTRTRFCQIQLEEHEDATLAGLRLALGHLWSSGQGDDQRPLPLAARPERREIFLARVLHALDGRLRALGTA